MAQEDLSGPIEQAREDFRPVTDQQLTAARAELTKQMNDVERFVRPSTANGQRWMRYLRWDDLKEELSKEGPPRLEVLDATLERLNRNVTGLELPQFRRLAAGLEHYRNLVAVSMWENPAELYGQQLEALEQDLSAYREDSTPANEEALRQRLEIIDDLGQAPELVAAIRQEYARPNAFVDVSTGLVAAGAEPINRRERITDNILGTSIRGDAHTTGNVDVATIPSEDRAVLQFRSRGRSTSQNVGNNGPAVIRSTGNTDFTATKRVLLSNEAFVSEPARAVARNRSDIHSISKRGGGLGSRMVANQGWQQARQRQPRTDAIAAEHAEERIERRFNEDVNRELREARERYEEEYLRPLARRGRLPEEVRFRSDENSLAIEATQASGGELGAPGPPPEQPQGHDLTLRLHESAVNNYSAAMMGGATASETEPGSEPQFDVELPEWMDRAWQQRNTESDANVPTDNESFKEWSMRFRERPISVDFDEGKVKITTQVERLRSGDQTFTDWNITGTYTPELAGGGVVLRREGDLEVLPADFEGQLSSRQAAERRNLEEEINERSAQGGGFPRTIEFEPMEPEGGLASAGPLEISEFTADDGWITVAWDRQGRGE